MKSSSLFGNEATLAPQSFIDYGSFETLGSDPLCAANSKFLSIICHVYLNNRPVRGAVKTHCGTQYMVNILPMPCHHGNPFHGVVITFERSYTNHGAFPDNASYRPAKTNEMSSQPPPKISKLTQRERQVLDLILEGSPNKIIAAELGVSQRTVENHRARVMRKMGAKSLSDLFRLSFSSNHF